MMIANHVKNLLSVIKPKSLIKDKFLKKREIDIFKKLEQNHFHLLSDSFKILKTLSKVQNCKKNNVK